MGLMPILLATLASALISIIGHMRDLASMIYFFNVECLICSTFKKRPSGLGLPANPDPVTPDA
jgi:hypothetical protein